ncbi:MAG: hypothetical protein IKY61_05260, partial [Thermoguttaceae bacterium]|nr:hypothetical protein [Thermoguttaceae bacterium]
KATLTRKASNSKAPGKVGDFYQMFCTAKSLPWFADTPIFGDATDNPEEITGFSYGGKPERVEDIEVKTRLYIPLAEGELALHQAAGDIFDVVLTYDDPLETKIYTVTVKNCFISSVKGDTVENNGTGSMTIKFTPTGGTFENIPDYAAVERTQPTNIEN